MVCFMAWEIRVVCNGGMLVLKGVTSSGTTVITDVVTCTHILVRQ